MSAPVMVSLELDDEAKLDAPMPIRMASKPDFPFGTRICLTNVELDKMGLDITTDDVGGIFTFKALARITSVSSSDGDQGPCVRVEAQIEAMCVECDEDGGSGY